MEGEAEGVAGGEEVGSGVQVDGYVVGGLGGEEGEEGGGGCVCWGGEGGAARWVMVVRSLGRRWGGRAGG